MDTNLILSLLFAIILTIVAIEWDESILLFMIGFMSILVGINLDNVFELSLDGYQGFVGLVQTLYVFIGIFAFTKTYFTAKETGFSLRKGKYGS